MSHPPSAPPCRDPATTHLLGAMQDPAGATLGLDGRAWSQLLATARATELIGSLAERLAAAAALPDDPRIARHLIGAQRMAERQRLSVSWEAQCLQDTLGPLGVPAVLLKGAAYVMAPEPLSPGRVFGDIDILVPREALGEVESALMLAGWISAKADAYDQRYYRQWMHEIPPLMHHRRGTVLDVHHTLLPPSGRLAPDPGHIVARARALPELPALRVPAVEDLLIHSLVHLVHEGEFGHGLRDLFDADGIVRAHADDGFWARVQAWAAGNDLAGPTGFGLALLARWLGTPVPAAVIDALRDAGSADWRRASLARDVDLALPPGPGGRGLGALRTAWARQSLYLRAHAMRMSTPLLLRHLARKAWMGMRPESPPQAAPKG